MERTASQSVKSVGKSLENVQNQRAGDSRPFNDMESTNALHWLFLAPSRVEFRAHMPRGVVFKRLR